MKRLIGLAMLAVLAVSCADKQPASDVRDATATPSQTDALPASVSIDPYDPKIDPVKFDNAIDNPYLPFKPGTTWRYEGKTDEGTETVEVTVTNDTKKILGIDCVVVKDEVKVDGTVVELTYDWYAQDDDGNVWYMGEDSKAYEPGKPAKSEGSWEAGVDGAKPGIAMPADPQVGQKYRQEFYEGEAEDTGEVLKVGQSVTVPAGSYDDVIVTEDINPFEPDVIEEKYYAKGVGFVLEDMVKGGSDKIELIEVTEG
jgi:hypothetical protein